MINPNLQDTYAISGVLTIREICKSTGSVLSEYVDENVVTELGINTMFLRAFMDDPDETMKLSNFFLGIDTGAEEDNAGGWDIFNPRPAQPYYTSLNQFSVYEVPESDMVIDYPSQNTLQAGTLLDGEFILNTFFPDAVDLRYTSATFRFANDTTFSYKRFPIRSLSRLIDVQIVWTFDFQNAQDFVCPLPPFSATLYNYYIEGSNSLMRMNNNLGEATSAGITASDYKILPDGTIYTLNGTTVRLYNQELDELASFSVLSSSLIDVHPNGDVIVVGGSRVVSYRNKSLRWNIILPTYIQSIWIVDQNRILIRSSQNIYLLSMSTGGILYSASYSDVSSLAATQDGEIFMGQPNRVVELLFDLSEVSNTPTASPVLSMTSHHDNDLLYAAGNILYKVNADLEFLWSRNVSGQIIDISVNREREIFVLTSSSLVRLNTDGTINSSTPLTNASKLISVGSRWGMED